MLVSLRGVSSSLFLPFLLALPLPFLPSNISSHLSFRSAYGGWLRRLGYPWYAYGVYILVNDSDSEQAATLYKSVLQHIAPLASHCIIWVTNK